MAEIILCRLCGKKIRTNGKSCGERAREERAHSNCLDRAENWDSIASWRKRCKICGIALKTRRTEEQEACEQCVPLQPIHRK